MSWLRKTDRAKSGPAGSLSSAGGPRVNDARWPELPVPQLGHFFDHFFILIIATVVLALGYTGICAIFPIIVALLHESSSR
jgi:hypothetical protein